ncbi:FERM domain-containing protein [Trichostrongylus colubriformis]|uniref:FERM domain-containing protein n=1 Tax=Trichostrongylus colubriformis TaxID=6319 RepID=A0AAN8EX56_TRICO
MKVASVPDIKVSVAEVCEVRGSGLEAHELLSLAAAAAESLPPCPRGTVFDTENVFITSKGNVEIRTVPQSSVDSCFVPPEWSKNEDDPGAAAVYCMGAVLRAAGAEHAADVDLFSLVNILTVGMVGTRPTAHRMGLMAKNQLRGRDAKVCLITIYEEIMGDEESNQLDDGDFSMDEDDDIGALLGNPPRHQMSNGVLPTVTVSSSSQPSVKKAVDYFDEDDEMESRGHSASTSSGLSTHKDSSPFFVDHDVDSKKDEPRTSTPPSAIPHESLGNLGSPIVSDSHINETYIEEHTINLDVSFDKPSDANVGSSSKVLLDKRLNGEVTKTITPFDGDDDELGSVVVPQRNSLEKKRVPEKKEKLRKQLANMDSILGTSTESDGEHRKVSKPQPKHAPLLHKFSSSDEEIVQARFDDDDEPPVAPRRRSYFDEIVAERSESVSQHETDIAWKRPNKKDNNETIHSMMSSPPGTSQAEDSSPKQKKSAPPDLADDDNVVSEREDLDRTHVDAVVITENRRDQRKSAPELTEDETPIEAAFVEAIVERRRSSVPPIADGIIAPTTPAPSITPPAAVREDSPHFERRNSLLPHRISGRQSSRSMRGKRKTRAVPEFYDHARHPSIRLKAPSAKKKKMTLMRAEQADVQVELLNGQRIEVSCRTDAVARDIFSLVVQHMNINEHVFFGLSFMKDGEHFFLEDHQRLEKFAPSGWRSAHKNGLRVNFVLYLRFRFYPQVLDFISKTYIASEGLVGINQHGM